MSLDCFKPINIAATMTVEKHRHNTILHSNQDILPIAHPIKTPNNCGWKRKAFIDFKPRT